MPKRACTTSNNTSNKRSKIDLSYEVVSPFNDSLVNSLDAYIEGGWDEEEVHQWIREIVRLLNDDDQGQPELTDDLLWAEINVFNYLKKSDLPTLNNVLTRFQARVRGAMTRNRVVPAMLSADPTDLRQAVLFCANGYK